MSKKYNEVKVKDNMKVEAENVNIEVSGNGEERERLTSVVSTEPVKVKKSLIGRLISGVAGPEGLPGIGAYVNEEIIKPAIKNIIVDAVTSGINMVMYGDRGHAPHRSRHAQGRGRNDYRPSVNYGSSHRNSGVSAEPAERMVRARGDVVDYVIASRNDASHVLTSLIEYADAYESVSVADYYDLIGVKTVYSDNNIGWTLATINRATIVAAQGGWIIKFPPAEVV